MFYILLVFWVNKKPFRFGRVDCHFGVVYYIVGTGRGLIWWILMQCLCLCRNRPRPVPTCEYHF
jgi:hypothetical protein